MSPKRQLTRTAAGARLGTGAGFRSHVHPVHQLTWARDGVLRIGADRATWVLTRCFALWVPAGVEHDVVADGTAAMGNLYFDAEGCPVGWMCPTPVDTTGLVGPLLDYLFAAPPAPQRKRAERVLFDTLRPMTGSTIRVPWPSDDRARLVADALLANPADPRTLTEWGRWVGASGRTLARVIERETGMGFARWRTQFRIAAAARRLATGERVAQVALGVGYRTPSSFVAAFRQVVGVSPGRYAAECEVDDPSDQPVDWSEAMLEPGAVIDLPGDFVMA